ncbi:MAG: AAA family ATPase [Planctomycetes bacterium]|nr:AAA family ATPase [Planctomycetota bacterium]
MTAEDRTGASALRPVGLEIAGFRGWRGAVELDLGAPLSVLIGENASGKSSTLNALEWCLFGGTIAKKGSGIDERADWDVVARDGAREARVVLRLATPEGRMRVERRRAHAAKAREADWFQVTLPSGDVLEGEEELAAWFAHSDLPDWNEWKRAFCQHQERSRARVLDGAERSIQLGRLLGLEQYQEWSERWKSFRIGDLEKAAQQAEDEVESTLLRGSDRPRAEADRLALQLERLGVDRMSLNDAMLQEALEELVRDGERLAQLAGLTLPQVDASRTGAVLEWAQTLPVAVKGARVELASRLREDEARRDNWTRALDAQEPTERAWLDARGALEAFVRENGSHERLVEESTELEAQRAALDVAERRESALLALLRQATELHVSGAPCPVCERADPDLDAKLRARTKEVSDAAARGREERRVALVGRLDAVRKKLAEWGDFERREQGADAARSRLREDFARHVPDGVEGGPASRAALDSFRRELGDRRAALDELDRRSVELSGAVERVDLLRRWSAENDRAQAARRDLEELPAWAELQSVLDEAAGLVRDIEVLADLTRQAQEARSAERVRVVNESLGAHYARITGADEPACARIQVKRTAAKLAYALVDGDGRDVLPVLNQAALNALSLAVLFAQAENRARDGRPAWLMLDDPEQSLDSRARLGLADALRDLSARLPVIVATFDGPFADALRSARGARGCRLTRDAGGHRLQELDS